MSTSVSGAPLEVALGVIRDAVKLCSPTDRGAGSAPADLVGYSMGGRVAFHFAARYPDRVGRLVLESASPGLADPGDRAARRAADARLARRISMSPIEDFVKYWEDTPLFESQRRLPPAVRARQRKVRLANDPQGIADALLGLGTGRLPAIWDLLPTIATPTLLIAGKLDAKFVAIAKRMVERMPQRPHRGRRRGRSCGPPGEAGRMVGRGNRVLGTRRPGMSWSRSTKTQRGSVRRGCLIAHLLPGGPRCRPRVGCGCSIAPIRLALFGNSLRKGGRTETSHWTLPWTSFSTLPSFCLPTP